MTTPSSRHQFYSRCEAVAAAASQPALLPRSLVSRDDDPSRVLRNGLAVSSFATLEAFVRSRTQEALRAIETGGVPFEDLPAGLKKAATEGAFRAAMAQVRYLEDRSRGGPSLLREVGGAVASTGQPRYRLSRYSLAHEGSNLNYDDIPAVLKAFRVEAPWQQLVAVAGRAGYASLPMTDFYEEISKRRHNAAHQSGVDTAIGDLQSFAAAARSFAMAFDLLVTTASRKVASGVTRKTRAGDVSLVFLEAGPSGRRLVDEFGATVASIRRSERLSRVLAEARRQQASLILRDRSGLPRAWIPHPV